jgi:cell division protein FtsB
LIAGEVAGGLCGSPATDGMRWPVLVLILLALVLQYPLWIGKGGWLRVWEVEKQLAAQKEGNRKLEQRNTGLEAEVRDLKTGYEAVEERARFELGLTKPDEIFVQTPQQK